MELGGLLMLRQQRYLGLPIGQANPDDDPIYAIRNIEDNSLVNHPLILNESYKGTLQGAVGNLPLYITSRSSDSELPGIYKGLHFGTDVFDLNHRDHMPTHVIEGRESVPKIGVLTIPPLTLVYKTSRIINGPNYGKSTRWNCYGPNTLCNMAPIDHGYQSGPPGLILERYGPTVEPNSLGCPRVPLNWQFNFPWPLPFVATYQPVRLVGGTHILRPSFDFNTKSRWGEWPIFMLFPVSALWLILVIYNSQGIGGFYDYFGPRDGLPIPGCLQEPFTIPFLRAENPGENWPLSITIEPDDGHEKYKQLWCAYDSDNNYAPIYYFDKYKFTLNNMIDPFLNKTHIIEFTPGKGWIYPTNYLSLPGATTGICQLTFENE